MNEAAQREIMQQQEMVLSDEERQPCEVWTRVMGYHRPVTSFNIGKKGEHYERQFFREARVA
ncbi:MAG: anaerobic ribonucleoside-triphosphate reductase [Burkholderiales bacterium]|nr:anaerobic ribonucleoside-triphosphate reductase [Burkholderiales bacterium]